MANLRVFAMLNQTAANSGIPPTSHPFRDLVLASPASTPTTRRRRWEGARIDRRAFFSLALIDRQLPDCRRRRVAHRKHQAHVSGVRMLMLTALNSVFRQNHGPGRGRRRLFSQTVRQETNSWHEFALICAQRRRRAAAGDGRRLSFHVKSREIFVSGRRIMFHRRKSLPLISSPWCAVKAARRCAKRSSKRFMAANASLNPTRWMSLSSRGCAASER